MPPTIPDTKIALLTKPSKLRIVIPGKNTLAQIYSFSLTAQETCPGATYKPNHKCKKCYAKKGAYSWAAVKNAQGIRTDWTKQAHSSDLGKKLAWLNIMLEAIEWATIRRSILYFRIHDSGDFWTPAYVDSWIEIAKTFPSVKFWAPTSSHPENAHENVQEYLEKEMLPKLQEFAKLPNVILRPSSREIGFGQIIDVEGLSAGTGIIKKSDIYQFLDMIHNSNAEICPSSTTDGNCQTCTSCWDMPDQNKYYVLH